MRFSKFLSNKDRHFLNKAIDLAKLSESKNFKHGAIIVKSGNIVGLGINYTINDPKFLADPVAMRHAAVHAEVAALNVCKKMNLKNATIYVARVTKSGEPRMSKPCTRCQYKLREAGIKKVFYTVDSEMVL